jgi:RimJ/RimL family protein N-acetyltransferase
VRCATAPVLHLAAGFDLRPAEPSDAPTVAGWMSAGHVRTWWDQAWPAERWSDEITRLAGGEHTVPCLASYDGEPFAYLELYRVRLDVLAAYYEYDDHDWGVHVAIGDAARTGAGLGRRLLAAVADALFAADPRCRRVVAEPDVRNAPSLRAFAAAGFERSAKLDLPGKTAALMIRTRPVEDR